MLSSRKTLEPRALQISTSRIILLSQSGISRRPPSSVPSFRRDLSWGSKHKDPTSRVGKVCEGFSTQDFAGKILTRKQNYRSTFWGNHHFRRYLPRYVPIQEWRFSSSWGNKPGTHSRRRNDAEANEEDDWYSRWGKHQLRQYDEFMKRVERDPYTALFGKSWLKLRQYDDFMKRVEHDPYTALFGKSWLNFSGEDNEPRAARTSSRESPKGTSEPETERKPGNGPSRPKSNNMKIPVDRDIGGRPSKSEPTPTPERDQEYEIDPITNRRLLKASPSPASALGHTKAQVKDAERDSEPFYKRWALVPCTPPDHRFVMVEHAQVWSSSNAPSKDTPTKPHNTRPGLAREGLVEHQEPKVDPQPILQTHDAKPNNTSTKIESALDRHLSCKSAHEKERSERARLQYKPEENKTEDIDLLRPSDVRASAGLRGNPPKETDIEKQARRKMLEDNYERCSLDRATQSAGEAASNTFAQKGEDRPERKGIATEFRFGSWLKETLQEPKSESKEASKSTPTTWVNTSSNARNFDPKSIDQISDLTPPSNNAGVSESSNTVAPEAQVKAMDKASKLKAQIVPFKAKLDAMKADYDFLRQEWLHELRRAKEQAAKKEEEMKAQKIAKRAREIHEAEIKTQKVAMEAMVTRSGNRTTNTAEATVAKSVGNDDVEGPATRRLQSFLQGEGDMASNVHEFAGRDRWYKRKAPHAMHADDAKLQKLASDRALICEIRGIYEETYGTIDTKHRQPHVLSTSPTGSRAGITKFSKRLDKSEIADALVIVQKLFGQLREVQSIIQDYRSQTNQVLDPNDRAIDMSETHFAFEKSVMQILRTSLRLARVRSHGISSRVSGEATAAADSEKPTVNTPPSTTESKPTNLEAQKATKLNTYCILAYDSASESVRSIEATTVAPFSKEESLLPLDALNRLSNPGKFLPHAISLGAIGYEPVSGTTNILVFKRKSTPQDLMENKGTDAMEKLTRVRNALDHKPVVPDVPVGARSGNSSSNPATDEGIHESHQTQLRGIEAEQQEAQEPRKEAVEKTEMEVQKAIEASGITADDIRKEKQAYERCRTQESASSASPSNTTSDMVHRQERVFSGSEPGKWVDHSFKSKRSKRAAAGRRRRTMRRMLMAGAFTAACCYCVGVGSEMMRG